MEIKPPLVKPSPALAQGKELVIRLLDALEELAPEWYSSSDLVLQADDWLKWFEGADLPNLK